MKINHFLIIFFLAAVNSFSMIPETINLTGWKLTQPIPFYHNTNLHEYINGQAPLYYELGFDTLFVLQYKKNNSEIILNIYQMQTPESAMAIYLTSAGNESPSSAFKERNSFHLYQSHLVKGKYYFQINTTNGDELQLSTMKKILSPILSNIKDQKISILGFLPKKNLIKGSERIARGMYSMRNIYYFGKGDPLDLNGQIFAVAGEYKSNNNKFTKLIINYPDIEQAKTVFDSLNNRTNKYWEIIEKENGNMVFKDIYKKFGQVILDQNVITINTKLENLPN